MPIRVEPFLADHIPAVRDFNERLQAGGAPAEYVFFGTPEPHWLPRSGGHSIYNELFLALDESVVRGAYALKRQPFRVMGETRSLGFFHHPFSEGIVAREHAMVGALLLKDALRREPLTYCLGMGSYDRPLPRMLLAMKWAHFAVPFRFRILRSFRFLRGMETLRKDRLRCYVMGLAAFSGVGWAGITILQAWRRRTTQFHGDITVHQEASFGAWADEVWNRCAEQYPLIAVRDRSTLNVLFPMENSSFSRLRIMSGNQTIGWAVVSVRQMQNHPHYGNLRVGQIVDVLSRKEHAEPIVRAAADFLDGQGADMVTCNHSHKEWVAALDRTGFLAGPSNFIFAAPRALSERLSPFETYQTKLFFTRADGDGLYQFL